MSDDNNENYKLRRFVEKSDVLDMDAYKDWINKFWFPGIIRKQRH